jgi:hypothetical protein
MTLFHTKNLKNIIRVEEHLEWRTLEPDDQTVPGSLDIKRREKMQPFGNKRWNLLPPFFV